MTSIQPQAAPPVGNVDWVPIWGYGTQNIPASQPSVRVWRSTVQSIPKAAYTAISYDTVTYDRGPSSHWSSGNPTRLTCQVAGTYAIYGSIQIAAAAGGDNRMSAVRVNGGPVVAYSPPAGSVSWIAGTTAPILAASTHYYLNVGDYIELVVYQDSTAGAQNTVVGVSYNEFGMALLGGMQGPVGPNISTYGTQLPTNPADGARHILVDSITNPSYQWEFRYNAAATSAYKWECVGGPPLVGWDPAGTGNIPNAWTAYTPSLIVPRNGEYFVDYRCGYMSPIAGTYMAMGVTVSGGAQIANSDVYMTYSASGAAMHIAATGFPCTLTAGQTLQLALTNTGASTGNCSLRSVKLIPKRVS